MSHPSPPIQATDGNFYGTTFYGGAGIGTVFEIMPRGTLTTLHTFFTYIDGDFPAGLIQDTNGNFYGTTNQGGSDEGCRQKNFHVPFGTIFSLSAGLSPFVETQATSGKVGGAVKILGTDLTGATSVTFNGTAATFTVVSSSEIKTPYPRGHDRLGRSRNARRHANQQLELPGELIRIGTARHR